MVKLGKKQRAAMVRPAQTKAFVMMRAFRGKSDDGGVAGSEFVKLCGIESAAWVMR